MNGSQQTAPESRPITAPLFKGNSARDKYHEGTSPYVIRQVFGSHAVAFAFAAFAGTFNARPGRALASVVQRPQSRRFATGDLQ
jgi:hypothetical protein